MYEVQISNYNATSGSWVTEKIHELNQNSMRRLASCQFTRGVSYIEDAQFTVLSTNPAYNKLTELRTLVKIINTKTSAVVFDGRVEKIYNDGMNRDGIISKTVTCEGCMAYLCDTIQPYHVYEGTASNVLNALISEHNAQVGNGSEKIMSIDCDISATLSFTADYRNTLETIKTYLLNVAGGELCIDRNGQGQLVLRWLQQIGGTQTGTTIELAKNMRSLEQETDISHIVTRLFPLGAYKEITVNNKKTKSKERYSITAAPAVVPVLDPTDPNYNPVKHDSNAPYIEDVEAVAKYGIITGTVTFDDLVIRSDHQSDDAAVIMNAGRIYLLNNNRIRRSYKAQILDLSLLGIDPDELKFGYLYRFVNSMIPIDEYLRLYKITVDIFNAHMPTVEIGDKTEKITDVAVKQAQLLEYDLPNQELTILDSAMATANSIINNATHGYVVFNDANNDGVPDEILIMNTPDTATATECWRWNSGGLRYASGPNAYDASATAAVAITHDGAINANYITAGILTGLEINNGSGTFHVDTNGNVTANSLTSNNATITGGSINIVTNSQTSDKINLTYSGWTIGLSPLGVSINNSGTNMNLVAQAGGLFLKEGNTDLAQVNRSDRFAWRGSNGNWVSILNVDSTLSTHSTQIGLLQTAVADHEARIQALENA